MVIDIAYIVYTYLIIFAVGIVLVAAALSLGTWGLVKYIKKDRTKYRQVRIDEDNHLPIPPHAPTLSHG